MDVVFIIESEELLSGELRAIVCDNRVWDSKAMGLDREDRSSLYLLCKLIYGDKKVHIALERPLERSDQIEPLDHEQPHDGDRLECLGR